MERVNAAPRCTRRGASAEKVVGWNVRLVGTSNDCPGHLCCGGRELLERATPMRNLPDIQFDDRIVAEAIDDVDENANVDSVVAVKPESTDRLGPNCEQSREWVGK